MPISALPIIKYNQIQERSLNDKQINTIKAKFKKLKQRGKKNPP